MRMKLHVLGLFCIIFGLNQSSSAQIIKPNDPGKTYYDSSYTKVYEVFHYLMEYQFETDQKNQKKFVRAVSIKDGPYIRYYPDGKLFCSGYFIQNEKDSLWKYYAKDGSIIKTELYREQELVE